MGADYKGQDRAIAELSALSREAKEYINHHVGNALSQVITGIEIGRPDIAKEAAWHIIDDLRMAGIRTTGR